MDSFFGNKIKESFFDGEDDKEKPTTTTAADHRTSTDHPTTTTGHHPEPTNSELFSSAKLVAEAAQYTFRKESDKVDKAKVADAAEDLLQAASKYGKLDDEKGIGKYVHQAEGYLHSYHSKTTTTTTGSGESAKTTTTTTVSGHSVSVAPKPSEHSGGEEKKSGSGGYGEYMKMAEGLFKNPVPTLNHESRDLIAGEPKKARG
ncbi:hypothetical protein RJ640_007958 [Escallonia rubra]|uniref:Uncharacterized protein n=1 Tax=Escallonia rubra TaxID=112253 RepID=A0AA88UFM0_9ASTE|nr:hypothetical protein RJ640_007958 [Escallonia rubra]